MPQHVTVVEYNNDWPAMFAAEADLIRRILGGNCVAVHHIGSTSVPGLAAKPVIDIMPVVKNIEEVYRSALEFAKYGYEYLGEFGIPGRRYLRKGGDERTHQVHIFAETATQNIKRHLAFRDYMRTHQAEREAYAGLKKMLAERFPYDIDAYCDGKDAFIKGIEAKVVNMT